MDLFAYQSVGKWWHQLPTPLWGCLRTFSPGSGWGRVLPLVQAKIDGWERRSLLKLSKSVCFLTQVNFVFSLVSVISRINCLSLSLAHLVFVSENELICFTNLHNSQLTSNSQHWVVFWDLSASFWTLGLEGPQFWATVVVSSFAFLLYCWRWWFVFLWFVSKLC